MHLRTLGWINQSVLVEHAGRFVDFFFVLSGFVIAYAYRERLEHGWTIPASVFDDDGHLCAHATGTFKYLRKLPTKGRRLKSQPSAKE